MIVISDASPLHHLVLIDAVRVLPQLFGRVLIPRTVARELQGTGTPAAVKNWIVQPPGWCEILDDPPTDPSLDFLDAGERAAIALATLLDADRILMDDGKGRAEAKRRRIIVTGTLGLLVQAHRAGLLDFDAALTLLLQTNIYLTTDLIDRARRSL